MSQYLLAAWLSRFTKTYAVNSGKGAPGPLFFARMTSSHVLCRNWLDGSGRNWEAPWRSCANRLVLMTFEFSSEACFLRGLRTLSHCRLILHDAGVFTNKSRESAANLRMAEVHTRGGSAQRNKSLWATMPLRIVETVGQILPFNVSVCTKYHASGVKLHAKPWPYHYCSSAISHLHRISS